MAYVIDRAKDAGFLREAELDMSTYKRFAPGDRVIVCAECNKVHLESSWQEAGNVCPNCGASRQKRVSSLNDTVQVTVLSKRGGSVRVEGHNPVHVTPRSGRFQPITAEVPVTGNGSLGGGTRRRRFRPLGLIMTGLILFLAFAPIKDFMTERFFTEAEAANEQAGAEGSEEREVSLVTAEESDWVVSDPIGCVVVAPACNVRTSPEVTAGNIITQLPKGTMVDWSNAVVNDEGTSWFYVTTLDEEAVTGWVSGKTIDYVYAREIQVVPHTVTAPESWHNAEREYTPTDMLDGYCLTSWYAEGDGIGAEITLEYEEAVVRNLVLINGDVKSEADYYASNRICELEIAFNNGEVYHTTLEDAYVYGGESYLIDTDTPSTAVTIRIHTVYEGENAHLAISDLSMYTTELDRSADVDGWRQ